MTVYADIYGYELWPYFAGALAVLLVVFRLRKMSISRLLCCAIFGVYLIYAAEILFFPLHISGGFAEMNRSLPFLRDIYLNPFDFGPFGSFSDALPTLALNILLTIPFGFGIRFVLPVRTRQIRWIAPAVGLAAEGTQLVISLLIGYVYRQIDTKDVLMNALGVVIGYALFLAFAWLYLSVTRHFRIPHAGLTAYVHDVATRD